MTTGSERGKCSAPQPGQRRDQPPRTMSLAWPQTEQWPWRPCQLARLSAQANKGASARRAGPSRPKATPDGGDAAAVARSAELRRPGRGTAPARGPAPRRAGRASSSTGRPSAQASCRASPRAASSASRSGCARSRSARSSPGSGEEGLRRQGRSAGRAPPRRRGDRGSAGRPRRGGRSAATSLRPAARWRERSPDRARNG